MEDQTSVFTKAGIDPTQANQTLILGGSGRFWIALICAASLCGILFIATYKGINPDAGSVAILASIVSSYIAQNKPK